MFCKSSTYYKVKQKIKVLKNIRIKLYTILSIGEVGSINQNNAPQGVVVNHEDFLDGVYFDTSQIDYALSHSPLIHDDILAEGEFSYKMHAFIFNNIADLNLPNSQYVKKIM